MRPGERLLGIDPDEASFARRGFAAKDPVARNRLELVGRTFVRGYRAGLAGERPGPLARTLDEVEAELRGFAYEGAAMALALLDQLTPSRSGRRFAAFVAGPGGAHVYMAHIGAGWALARLRRGPAAVRRLDPVLRWLALDGYGFHQGYFAPARHLECQRVPRRFSGYERRAFDQGLGRALWFAAGGDVEAAAARIGGFPAARRADLWSGLALAAAYAGPSGEETLDRLAEAGAAHAGDLAQGAAFAAGARAVAGNPAPHTDLACRRLAGRSASESGDLAVRTLAGLPPDGARPAYEVWRGRLRDALAPGSARQPA